MPWCQMRMVCHISFHVKFSSFVSEKNSYNFMCLMVVSCQMSCLMAFVLDVMCDVMTVHVGCHIMLCLSAFDCMLNALWWNVCNVMWNVLNVRLHVMSCRKVCHVTLDVLSHRCRMGCHITILSSLLFDCVIAFSWVFRRICVWIMWLWKDNLLLSTWIDTIFFVWLIPFDYRQNCVVLFAYVMPMWFLLKKLLGRLRAIW